MGTVIQELRDNMNRKLGTIEQEFNGNLIIRDNMNIVKGTYNPTTNQTRDNMNRLVGTGNLLTTLL